MGRSLLSSFRTPSCLLIIIGLMALGRSASAAPKTDAPDQASPALGSITGTVAVAETGQPVPDALVRVLGTSLQATTRGSGHFTIPSVPAGLCQVSVVAPGYLEATLGEVRVSAGSATSIQVKLQPTPNFMEQVQVTASKEPLTIGEVPAQATVIDNGQIARKGDLELTQAITNIPGLVVSSLYVNFQSVLLRGMPRDGQEFTSTLLLIDGVPQTDSRNSSRVTNLPINDVNSIEVVRGPNSALYGRTAIAGSVNVLTAEPTLEHRATFDAQVGEFNHLKGQATASGPIQDWGGYYVSWAAGESDGYHKQSYNLKNKENSVFMKFTFTPDDKSHGKVTFNNVTSDNGLPTEVPIIGGRFLNDIDPRFDRLTNLNLPESNYHQEELRTTLNYSRQLTSWAEFVETFGYRAIQYRWENNGEILGSPFDLNSQTVTMYPFEQTENEKIFYEDGHFVIKPHLGHIENSLLAGASFEHLSGFVSGNFIFTDPITEGWPLNYLTDVIPDRSTWIFSRFGGNDYVLNSTGVFGQYIISPTQRLLFNIGGRYDHLSLNNVKTFAVGRPQISEGFNAFSPKLSATVKVLGKEAAGGRGALNIYAVYSRAFLPPRTPNNLAPADEVIKLEPEKIKNYEVGLKGNLLGGKLSLEGTFFKMERDGIVVQTREGPFFRDSNAGIENFRGVEVGVTWAPIHELSFYANGAFYHNRFGDFVIQSPSGSTPLTGNRLPISPDRVYSAGATFQHQSGWEATLNLKHVGDVALDQNNTFTLPPYTVVDASLSWKHSLVRFTLGAHNLFNEKYYNMGDTSAAETADAAPPRQVVLSASFTFK
jgi:outer membrane receptor protein involved in Fe transport